MSKKILSVMLALVMVLSVFSVAAFAANAVFEDPDAEEAYTQMWYLETTNEPNADGDYTVDVYLEANYAVGAISFHIDAEGATLKDAVASDLLCDPDGYNAYVDFTSNGNVYIMPEPASAAAKGLNLEVAECIATLTFELTADIATITLVNDAFTIDNDGKLIAARLGDGVLSSNTMYYGQWVVDAEYEDVALGDPISEVTLGQEAAEPADLALTATGEANGVVIDTNKTFGGAYAGVVYGFPLPATATTYRNTAYLATNLTATNGGTLTYATSTAGGYGTSATITVKNSDGSETGKVYVVVIFGDVNCDGRLNANDTSAIKLAVGDASNAPVNSVKRLAANVFVVNNATQMHTLNANDTTAMKKHVAGTSKFAPANLATIHNRYNNFYQ